MGDNNNMEEMPPPKLPSAEIVPPAEGAALSLTKTKSKTSLNMTPPTTTTNTTAASTSSTPASSITGGPTSRLRAPTNYSGDATGGASKIGRLCSHATPKAGPPPRDTKSMSRESDDNLSSINSAYTDLYQETVKRFTRSSLSPEMDRYSSSRNSTKSTTTSHKSGDGERHTSFDLYLEATGRRRSSDHGAVLTQDTEQFIIGQKVWVGGIRPGQIAYIGETHFAPGDWAGIVLDEPNGKNDGCVAGKRYFQCEPKRGIFSRLTRLTLTPLSGAHTPTSPLSKMSPDRSRTVSPTASVRSSFLRSPGGKNGLTVGDRIIVSSGFGSRPGILRYLGETQFASGNWCGVELDEPSGKNDGSVDGIKYFECRPKYGVFVPIAKVSLSPSSKKTRLSRTGSRESLNSIGTINSIATTNTSRLRMNAQRKPLSIKPLVATPKSQYSMQDLLHEKQKHVEQLMIERELDREDSQNQALQYQKNINELKTRILQLERSLDDERKKSEDLQFSIDEATYCGNDAQNNVYKEKIQHLEKKISELSIASATKPSTEETTAAAITAATESANAKISELTLQLQQQKDEYEIRIVSFEDEQKRLQENIEYLRNENEVLQKELVDKDESLEKYSLSACGVQNLQHELDLIKEEAEKERQQLQIDFNLKLEEKNALLDTLRTELTVQKNTLSTLESERSNIEDECEILRTECKSRDAELQNINAELAKLKAEFSMQKAENATLEELLKAQQTGNLEGKTQIEEKLVEIKKLKEEIIVLKKSKEQSENQLKAASDEVKHLAELQKSFEDKLKALTSADQDKVVAMTQMGMVMEELKKQISNITVENENLKTELKKTQEINNTVKSTEEELRKTLQEKEREFNENLAEIKKSNANMEESLKQERQKLQDSLNEKAKEYESLKSDNGLLQERVKSLESDSSASVQQLSAKLNELEAQAKMLHDELESKKTELKTLSETNSQQERILAEKTETLLTTTSALETTNNLANKLKQELDVALTKCADLESTNKIQAEQCAQQKLEIGDLTRKLESLNTKCDSLGTQNQALENDLRSARTTITELETEVRKLNEELNQRQKNLHEMQTNSNNERLKLESQLEELTQKLAIELKNLEEQHANTERARNEVTKKNTELAVLDEKAIKLELALSASQREYENLQAKYDSLVEQKKTLEDDLNTLRTTSTDSNTELIKITQQVAVKQKAYDDLLDKTNTERSTLESQLQASQQRIDALCSQVETLTEELKGTTEESFKHVDKLKQEQEKCGKQELELSDLHRKLESITTKCAALEKENENLQKNLATMSTASSATVNKLTEELSQKQKLLQDITDKSATDHLLLANQMQELQQRLETSLQDTEKLRKELEEATVEKNVQATEFDSLKIDMEAKTSSQLNELKEKEAAERKKIIENFETQLKGAEQTKVKLDEAISSLQQQIKLLQDELLKSQLDFKSKEEELGKQITNLNNETDRLQNILQQTQIEGSSSLSNIEAVKEDLKKQVEILQSELKTKDEKLKSSHDETEQLKLAHSNVLENTTKLQDQIKTLQNALDLANNEVEYRTKLANEDKSKMEELRNMVETVQTVNAHISSTNAEMSEALQALEQEKSEAANIFELFEMESDQNMEKLAKKLMDMKQQLAESQNQLQQQAATIIEKEIALETTSSKFEASQTALATVQSTLMENAAKLNELNTANAELQKLIDEKEQALQQQLELQSQLVEYKNVVDEMDQATTIKGEELQQLQERIKQLEQEKLQNIEAQKVLKTENVGLQRKLEIIDLEKTREIVALQSRINDLQAISKLKHNNSTAGSDSVPKEGEGTEDNTAQINFLNSIIADMQKKNDTLKAKIEALEALPTDFTQPKAFELIAKRKPAPRVFCDICDEFDRHETEDCPLQASDDRDYSPPPSNDPENKKERKLPEPRKYCETCEVFGHETGECDDDEW